MPSHQPQYNVYHFGNEQHPVVVIDDLIHNPDALKKFAATQKFETTNPFYPGIRAAANPRYLTDVIPLINTILKAEFNCHNGADFIGCDYSLVTTRPEALIPIQCRPHYDGVDENKIAVLHYLCDPADGGTAFYRHKETGYESISADRATEFKASVKNYAAQHGDPPKQYFTTDTEQYERIGHVNAAYNRCVIYKGNTLHSGDIPKGLRFDTNPETGRLTINSFLLSR